MSFLDDIAAKFSPHIVNFNNHLNAHGALIHARLKSIDEAVSDLGKPDVGDKWFRQSLGGVQKSGERVDYGTVPQNEIWSLMAVTNALREGTTFSSLYAGTHFICQMENAPTLLTPGGDIVFLPGEKIEVEVGENEKESGMTLHLVRHRLPVVAINPDLGPKHEFLGDNNTHDPNRDNLTQSGTYNEIPGIVENTVGEPPLVGLDPTSVL